MTSTHISYNNPMGRFVLASIGPLLAGFFGKEGIRVLSVIFVLVRSFADLTHSLPRSKISTTFGRWRDQHSQKIVLLPIASKFGPQEVNRFSQLCAKFQALGSFELHATIFSNLVKMALPSGRILSRLLRRMKAFMDEFHNYTSNLHLQYHWSNLIHLLSVRFHV